MQNRLQARAAYYAVFVAPRESFAAMNPPARSAGASPSALPRALVDAKQDRHHDRSDLALRTSVLLRARHDINVIAGATAPSRLAYRPPVLGAGAFDPFTNVAVIAMNGIPSAFSPLKTK